MMDEEMKPLYSKHMLPTFETAFREDQLTYGDPYRISRTAISDFPLHWHSCMEIIFMLYGNLSCRVNNCDYSLSKGDFLLINSGDLHSFRHESSKSNDLLLIHMEPTFYRGNGLMMDKEISAVSLFSKKKHFPSCESEYPRLYRLMEKIVREIADENEASSLIYSSSFLELLHFYYSLEDVEDAENREQSDRLRDVLAFVASNFHRDISLEDGADAAKLSLFHFSRLFKQMTGQTFTQYVRTYRIKYACHLLLTTDEPVTEIAYQCGYSSLKTFYRQFKTVESISPGKKRREIAKIENH